MSTNAQALPFFILRGRSLIHLFVVPLATYLIRCWGIPQIYAEFNLIVSQQRSCNNKVIKEFTRHYSPNVVPPALSVVYQRALSRS